MTTQQNDSAPEPAGQPGGDAPAPASPQPPSLPPPLSEQQVSSPDADQALSAHETLDTRLNAYRPDLASSNLQGRVDAKSFVDGEWSQVSQSVLPLRSRPDVQAGFTTEALFGELVTVYEVKDGWAWVQLARDQYVGYVPVNGLERDITWPTHHVKALGTFVYPEPSIKTPPISHISLN
ncbi:MAG: SH3 domain-containing protein, partial [Pseudomonadota bacterium]